MHDVIYYRIVILFPFDGVFCFDIKAKALFWLAGGVGSDTSTVSFFLVSLHCPYAFFLFSWTKGEKKVFLF